MTRLAWAVFLFLIPAMAPAGPRACTPSVEAVIEQARATIGSEEALQGLITIQMEGRVESARPMQPEGNIRIVMRRPNAYRSTIRIEDMAEETIVQGGEGCMVRSSPALEHSRMRSLAGEEIHRIAATIHHYFHRFRPGSANPGAVRHHGIVDMRGTRSHHLRYSYPGGVTVDRFFAVDDGRLVCTINDLGVESVPVGKRMVDGLLFPEKVEYYENREKLHTIIFTRIEVNKPLPAGIFAIPR